jgi:outer membrane protein TolC
MTRVCIGKGRAPAALIVLAATVTPRAASAEVVTLQQLEEVALQNQAASEAFEATTKRASAEVAAARANLRPSFLLNASGVAAPGSFVEQVLTTEGRVVNVTASPTVRESSAFRPNLRYEGIVAIRAPIYEGQTRASIRAAEAYRDAAGASSRASRQDLLTSVRTTYLEWLAAYLEHDFTATAAVDASAERERVGARVADGDIPPSDLDAARHQELEAALAAAKSEARLVRALHALESAVGDELGPTAEPDRSLLDIEPTTSDSSDSADWAARALESERDAARQEARMHLKGRSPVLAVVGQTGVYGINENVFPMYRVGLNLAVPLWDGGRAVALAETADARAAELDALARDAKIADRDAREQAVLDRVHADQQLELATALVSVSQRRVTQAKASYELGEGSLDAVSDARASLREAQSRRVQIQVARADALLRSKRD